MKGPVILGALLAVAVAVPIAMERNRITPDVWAGTPSTDRQWSNSDAEMSQEARDLAMRSKFAGQVPVEVRGQNDATAAAVITFHNNMCGTPLSARNQKYFEKITTDPRYTTDQAVDAMFAQRDVIATIGKSAFCAVTKDLGK